jgi:hypothetical protein
MTRKTKLYLLILTNVSIALWLMKDSDFMENWTRIYFLFPCILTSLMVWIYDFRIFLQIRENKSGTIHDVVGASKKMDMYFIREDLPAGGRIFWRLLAFVIPVMMMAAGLYFDAIGYDETGARDNSRLYLSFGGIIVFYIFGVLMKAYKFKPGVYEKSGSEEFTSSS